MYVCMSVRFVDNQQYLTRKSVFIVHIHYNIHTTGQLVMAVGGYMKWIFV
jgi:hypothetical protein